MIENSISENRVRGIEDDPLLSFLTNDMSQCLTPVMYNVDRIHLLASRSETIFVLGIYPLARSSEKTVQFFLFRVILC